MSLPPLPGSLLLTSEPVRRSHFELEIASSPVGAMPNKGMELRALPDLIAQRNTIPAGLINSSVNIPGVREPTSGCINFNLHTEISVLRWWWKWWEFIENGGEPALYENVVGQGVVRVFGSGLEERSVVASWELVDIWPSRVSVRSMEQDSDGDPVTYEVDLQIAEVNLITGSTASRVPRRTIQ